MNKCKTKRCKHEQKKAGYCWTCYDKIRNAADPVKYCYKTLKNNAKRRGVLFTLTLEFFRQFCYETNYIAGKGRQKHNYSIDRIDNARGYEPDNIQILTQDENKRKYTKTLLYDWRTRQAVVITNNAIVFPDQPF